MTRIYFLTGISVRRYLDKTGTNLCDVLAHERLSIIDPIQGAQPLYDRQGNIVLAVNGEIYNHQKLRLEFEEEDFSTNSDCEPIIYLYKKYGSSFIDRLDGVFAFVIASTGSDGNNYLAARDAIGIFPLYYGHGNDGSIWFASEVKALVENCESVHEFPPGHFWTSETGFQSWYRPKWFDHDYIPSQPVNLAILRDSFEKAVIKRLMTDVP